jgi:hypothetical protein
MTVIGVPCQLDEKTEGATFEKWSVVHALLGYGLGSVLNALEETVEFSLLPAVPVMESAGLNSWGFW